MTGPGQPRLARPIGPEAMQRVFDAAGRETTDPIIVIVMLTGGPDQGLATSALTGPEYSGLSLNDVAGLMLAAFTDESLLPDPDSSGDQPDLSKEQ